MVVTHPVQQGQVMLWWLMLQPLIIASDAGQLQIEQLLLWWLTYQGSRAVVYRHCDGILVQEYVSCRVLTVCHKLCWHIRLSRRWFPQVHVQAPLQPSVSSHQAVQHVCSLRYGFS